LPVEPKQFYIAQRHPSMSRAEFQENWRGHGELAMSVPLWSNIFRYTQGDAIDLPADVAQRLPDLDPSSDGVSTIWFRSFEAVLNIPADPDHPILLRDEARIFATMVADISVFTEEDVVHDAGAVAVKIVTFLARDPAQSPQEFERAWRDHARAIADIGEVWQHVSAHRVNVAVQLPGDGAGEPSQLAGYDGVSEIGFASVDAMAAAVREPRFEEVVDGMSAFTGGRRTLVTSELLLYAE